MRTKNLLLSCALDDGSLCYRQRFLLRKLLVNKWWSQVACSFNVWRAFCSDSSAVLARLLAVDQRQRQRCALLRWRRMVRCQQLGEQAEATVIVRHSHQAAKILARMIAKHEKLLLISREARYQKRNRFQHWKVFASHLKAHRRDRDRSRKRPLSSC
ncbi:hypothetical protein PI125_g20991 [Phytophthora idaei]|nr:hypothetical protein PI125_g20991 [Phytophthora idaei]